MHHIDILLIQTIRPSLTGVQDKASWMHTTDGNYTVKSGYNLLQANHGQASDTPISLFKSLWKFQLPSKIKHFLWRVLHNAIPVASNLKQRKIINDSIFSVCGEKEETVNHIIFQCRVSKEIWDLAPVRQPSEAMLFTNRLEDNYVAFLEANQTLTEQCHCFIFWVGVFGNKGMRLFSTIGECLSH